MKKIVFYKKLILYFSVIAVLGLLAGGIYSAGYNRGRKNYQLNNPDVSKEDKNSLAYQLYFWSRNNIGNPSYNQIENVCATFKEEFEASAEAREKGNKGEWSPFSLNPLCIAFPDD